MKKIEKSKSQPYVSYKFIYLLNKTNPTKIGAFLAKFFENKGE